MQTTGEQVNVSFNNDILTFHLSGVCSKNVVISLPRPSNPVSLKYTAEPDFLRIRFPSPVIATANDDSNKKRLLHSLKLNYYGQEIPR